MAASYTYTCYLIDVSPSMADPLDPEGDEPSRSKLSYAIEFVKTKLIQRLINPLKTDQIAIVVFGGETNNQLAAEGGREGYENIQELVAMRQPNFDDLRRLDRIEIGHTDVDMVAALYVAGNLVRNAKVARKTAKKRVILLTDAEEATTMKKSSSGGGSQVKVATDWDDEDFVNPLYDAIVPGHKGNVIDWKDLFEIGVIGMDFGDAEMEENVRSGWSEAKRINVESLTNFVNKINKFSEQFGQPRALMGSVHDAIQQAGAPAVTQVQTRRQPLLLHIGDTEADPHEAMSFNVEVQKATQRAPVKTMQKMRRGAWHKSLKSGNEDEADGVTSKDRGKKRRRSEDGDDDDDTREHEEDHVGAQAPGQVVQEKLWYYVPEYNEDGTLKIERAQDDDSEPEDEDEKMKRAEASRRLENDEYLSRAYKYGSDLIPISREEEVDFYTFPAGDAGLFVRGFVKAADYHPEWALNDPYWVFGGPENRSQLFFSALLWALNDTNTHALIRMLPAKSVQPRLCLLIPRVGQNAVSETVEMGLLIQLPFKEEVANWSFPSLDRIHTTTGRPVLEHRLLPKKDLLDAMDDFVDSMLLPAYVVEDDAEAKAEQDAKPEEILTTPWFEPSASFNPAIHNLRNAIVYKIVHPDANLKDGLPEVHPDIARFLYPPEETMDASASAATVLAKAADLSLVPPKPKMTRGKGYTRRAMQPTTDPLKDILGQDFEGSAEGRADQRMPESQLGATLYRHSQSQSQMATPTSSNGQNPAPAPVKTSPLSKHKKTDDDDSATEESGTEDSDAGHRMHVDKEKPNLISDDRPLEDLEALLSQPAMITPAITQMLIKITHFVDRATGPSSSKYRTALQCLERIRESAISEDEATRYNDFLRGYKERLESAKSAHLDFFEQVKARQLGLITVDDDDNIEGTVSAKEAAQFWAS